MVPVRRCHRHGPVRSVTRSVGLNARMYATAAARATQTADTGHRIPAPVELGVIDGKFTAGGFGPLCVGRSRRDTWGTSWMTVCVADQLR